MEEPRRHPERAGSRDAQADVRLEAAIERLLAARATRQINGWATRRRFVSLRWPTGRGG